MSARPLVALFFATALVACDHVADTAQPAPAAPAAVTGPLVAGTLYSDRLAPVAGAEVVVAFEGADGGILAEETVTSAADGTWSVSSVPAGATLIHTHAFVGGDFMATRSQPVVGGAPRDAHQAIIFGLAGPLCWATTWATARDVAGGDKMKHCVASCRTVRWCGASGATLAASLKETLDSYCKNGPDWLKAALASSGISSCGGWDAADMAANQVGFACAPRLLRSCERCCDATY
jgi:hypothetical protein